MSDYSPPIKDIVFSLQELHDYTSHYAGLGSDMTLDDISVILNEVGKFSVDILAPINRIGDTESVRVEDGKVITPPGFKEAYQQFMDAGWPLLSQPEKYGGMPAPYSLKQAVSELLQTSNHSWCMYTALNDGAIKSLLESASDDLVDKYVPKLVTGEWLSTMCLTEPEAGSDLNLVKTRAVENGDGSYSISGNKIFISSGDHDFTENIIHLVLARLPDAPPGTRGISLFLVPKKNIDTNNSNGVVCVSVEKKMGLKGSATCQMAFDGAKGWLVGAPNRGLRAMFVFINKSRLAVAQQAQGHIEAGYQVALKYARERLQGRADHEMSDSSLPADPLILQADVQRMLMIQRAFSEGGRALIHLCAKEVDLTDSPDKSEALLAEKKSALLIPIAKGFLSEVASEATDLAIQILGGHGYICEWGLEQRVRDVRVTRIYEGTTGIQGQDLLLRKVMGDQGESLYSLLNEMLVSCERAGAIPELQSLSDIQRDAVEVLKSLTDVYLEDGKGNINKLHMSAVDYLMLTGYVVLGWLWLKSAIVAFDNLMDKDVDSSFYQEKVFTAKFYLGNILPRIYGIRKISELTFNEPMPGSIIGL